jgi:DNA-directed RNA polymerase specialized sigma24 family protein
VSNEQTEFTEFFRASWEPCLRAVVVVAGSPQLAEDQVAEAFAKAWVSWRKVRRHPAPRAWVVRTALNTGASWWRRRRRELPLADHDLIHAGRMTRTRFPARTGPAAGGSADHVVGAVRPSGARPVF